MIFFVPLKNNILILYIFQITYLRHFSVFLIILTNSLKEIKLKQMRSLESSDKVRRIQISLDIKKLS